MFLHDRFQEKAYFRSIWKPRVSLLISGFKHKELGSSQDIIEIEKHTATGISVMFNDKKRENIFT